MDTALKSGTYRQCEASIANLCYRYFWIIININHALREIVLAFVMLAVPRGIVAFGLGSAGGGLLAKFMNLFLKEKINPLIGSAGVSAVPMAARVSQTVGQEENPSNFLLMHAMGPNVAGVIGSAVAAGVLLTMLG